MDDARFVKDGMLVLMPKTVLSQSKPLTHVMMCCATCHYRLDGDRGTFKCDVWPLMATDGIGARTMRCQSWSEDLRWGPAIP